MSFRRYITEQVQKLASPAAQDAIANLLALSPLAIPHLVEEFWSARNPDIRAAVVFVIAQFADASSIEFFIAAMDDVHEQCWMNALDGLVNIGGAAVVKRLITFMVTLNPDDIRGAWTMEAIEQLSQAAR